jgi:hypothetical protein
MEFLIRPSNAQKKLKLRTVVSKNIIDFIRERRTLNLIGLSGGSAAEFAENCVDKPGLKN